MHPLRGSAHISHRSKPRQRKPGQNSVLLFTSPWRATSLAARRCTPSATMAAPAMFLMVTMVSKVVATPPRGTSRVHARPEAARAAFGSRACRVTRAAPAELSHGTCMPPAMATHMQMSKNQYNSNPGPELPINANARGSTLTRWPPSKTARVTTSSRMEAQECRRCRSSR